MDFECDFNDLSFCQYSNLGWGFQKSVLYRSEVKPIINLPTSANFFPCSVSNNAKEGSRLEKRISLNSSQSLCLRFAYMLEEKGQIFVTHGQNQWSKNASVPYSQWNYIRFPINVFKIDNSQTSSSESALFKITGESVCVDNFTVSTQPCPLTATTFVNNLSPSSTYWLTQPFSLLVAILTLVVLFTLIGFVASVMFAKKTQRALYRSKQLSRKLKHSRIDRYSFQNSTDNGTTINSCCDIDTLESNRFFAHHNRFLPTVIHVRSNPQLARYSRQSFAASSSVETTDSTPHFRFSLALTEDAQVQLLNNNNNNSSGVSPPVTGDLLIRNLSIVRQQSLITNLSHESTPSPNDNGNNQRPNSIVTGPTFCAPIIDQSESDLSMESVHLAPIAPNRRRPIRESMNIGYVSDTSLCDLPQYDTAVQLLAEHKTRITNSDDAADNSDEVNVNDDDDDDDGDDDNNNNNNIDYNNNDNIEG